MTAGSSARPAEYAAKAPSIASMHAPMSSAAATSSRRRMRTSPVEPIAGFYPGADPENVTVVNGGSEANFVTLWSLLNGPKGDRLACMIPNYMQAWGMGRHFGAGSDAFRLRPTGSGSDARWGLDLD